MSDIEKRISLLEKDATEIKGLRESRHQLNNMVHNHDNLIREMLKAPTNQDLQMMLLEMNGNIKLILSKQADAKEWQDEHQKADKLEFESARNEFAAIRREISGMNKYASSIAVVAAAIGAGFYAGCNWIIRKVTG